ncbi:hypothetical protein [Solilutibacter tolerans]|uniref:Uncharacterized protein n=1 Tax=Solilutibacter tolerans TaxID=1604334 RepID=A0A1N6YH83_9GAMM|nr:hypothetical protein [Lysobacter tolerans]SIR13866.1 hypothetical protein SAMN05421546_2473 [Lysobacter tolerans]
MTQITITDTEFLISLPYSHRERAKNIPDYRWDPAEKVWRYYRSPYIYDRIIYEFGPDEIEWLDAQTNTQHNALESPELTDLRRRLLESWEKQIETNTKLMNLMEAAFIHGFPENGTFDEFHEFTQAAYSNNRSSIQLLTELAVSRAKIADLEAGLNSSLTLDVESLPRAIVSLSWGSVGPLPTVLQNLKLDRSTPIVLSTSLVKHLASLLRKESDEQLKFQDLIREAEDARILTSNGARLCQTLRVQRNLVAHEDFPDNEVLPRGLLCVISYALVARELLTH